jgi:hypothetical protein
MRVTISSPLYRISQIVPLIFCTEFNCVQNVLSIQSRPCGEVSEWLKEHAWKVCIRQRIEGSNPSFSAK